MWVQTCAGQQQTQARACVSRSRAGACPSVTGWRQGCACQHSSQVRSYHPQSRSAMVRIATILSGYSESSEKPMFQ